MTDASRAPRPAHDQWLRAGVVMVVLGTTASIATLLPLALGADALPLAAYLISFLAPLGLGVILVALWHRARTRSQRLKAQALSEE